MADKMRVLKHYALTQMETKTYSSIRFRCNNSACVRKSFVHYPLQEGGAAEPLSSEIFVNLY